MTARYQKMCEWLSQQVDQPVTRVAPITGDASFRRYFRVSVLTGSSFVLMDAPPQQENCSAFVKVAALFACHHICVPNVYAQDVQQGFVLLEDFGDTTLLSALTEENSFTCYVQALTALKKIQAVPTDSLPSYSKTLLLEEMRLSLIWYFDRYKKRVIAGEEAAAVESVFNRLLLSIDEQPTVCVHRDFHSRNLMLKPNGTLGVLDFQDAVIGPVTYDLVSLLKDCYSVLSLEQRTRLLKSYFEALPITLRAASFEQFEQWFDWLGLQRHLKCLGIFARLHVRDQKSGYLADIPRVLAYIRQVCERYSDFGPLQALIE